MERVNDRLHKELRDEGFRWPRNAICDCPSQNFIEKLKEIAVESTTDGEGK